MSNKKPHIAKLYLKFTLTTFLMVFGTMLLLTLPTYKSIMFEEYMKISMGLAAGFYPFFWIGGRLSPWWLVQETKYRK